MPDQPTDEQKLEQARQQISGLINLSGVQENVSGEQHVAGYQSLNWLIEKAQKGIEAEAEPEQAND